MADKLSRAAAVTEVGRTGLTRWGGIISEEFMLELRGSQGRKRYREMSENDAIIGGLLFSIEQMIGSAIWSATGAEGRDAEKATEFLESCLTDMSHTWGEFIQEVLTVLVYGWQWTEIVYKVRGGPTASAPERNSKYDDGLIGWRKLAPRKQDSLYQWKFDDTGGLQGMEQMANGKTYFIPIDKSLHFTTKPALGNPEGQSILRNCYRSYFFKKRIEEIEVIGVERELAGIPVLTAPEGVDLFSETDPKMIALHAYCEKVISTIRQDEQHGVLLSHGWDFKLVSAAGSRAINTSDVINRFNRDIAMRVLAQFLLLGSEGKGSYALSLSHKDLFTLALKGWLEKIAEVINRYGVDRLFQMNAGSFNLEKNPQLVPSNIREPDLSDIADPLAKVTTAGLIVPDQTLEAYLRELGGLPESEQPEEPTATTKGADAGVGDLEEEVDDPIIFSITKRTRESNDQSGDL
ncbi:MAG: hypothetical protein WC683_04700 [bacterium]